MKKNLIWIFILMSTISCLDDKSNYDYKDVNDFEGWNTNGVKNVASSYTLYPGETLKLEPKVRFSIDTVNLDASYSWSLGTEKEMKLLSDQLNYTYTADKLGDYDLIFSAMDRKTGVVFRVQIDITVVTSWKNGWMVLSKSPANESQLSMILSKKKSRMVIVDGREQKIDTVVYVGEARNVVPNLGQGPRKLVENFICPGADGVDVEDEVMVLQESGCVELEGNGLQPVGFARDEFFDGMPAKFDPVGAVLSWGGKWLLNTDHYVYSANMAVAADLHSGRYLKEPMFNGKKVKELLPYLKFEDNFFVVGIDEDNTFFGILDDGSYDYYGTDYVIFPANHIGAYLELGNVDEKDRWLFKNIDGEYIFHAWADESKGPWRDGSAYVSILRRGGSYYWHSYSLNTESPRYRPGLKMVVAKSEAVQLDASIMTDYKCAALLPWKKLLVIASGSKLHGFSHVTRSGVSFTSLPDFNSEIVDIAVKDYQAEKFSAHLAVALKSGDVYVFEVKYDTQAGTAQLKPLYHQGGFGEIIDLEYKFGRGSRPTAYGPY